MLARHAGYTGPKRGFTRKEMIMRNASSAAYERPVTPIERLFTRSPFSVVTMVARIQGLVTESMLRDALDKVCLRHVNLRVRIVDDEHGNPYFTADGAGEIPMHEVPWESEDQWIHVMDETSRVPLAFDERPPIRFFLLQGPDRTDLVIVSHHIICDGMSLAFLAKDLMAHLGDPSLEPEALPDPVQIGLDSLPEDVHLNLATRAILRRMNRKWDQQRVLFDHQDYLDLTATYWSELRHMTLPILFSEAETDELVARCKSEDVSVNTALTAAFAKAQMDENGGKLPHPRIGIATSLRGRLRVPVGEAMGFYASSVTFKAKWRRREDFWSNARRLQRRMQKLIQGKGSFKDPTSWCYLDPTFLEATSFKKLGGLVPPDAPSHEKLSAFARQDDAVKRILKLGKMDSLDKPFMGTWVTNLTRLDFPRRYGELELDRLILHPGAAYPLSQVVLVIGAVTCAGKLSLVMEFADDGQRPAMMRGVQDIAVELLLGSRVQ